MLKKFHKLQLKPKMIDEFKVALQTIREELPQEHINNLVEIFTKHLTTCMSANGGHFQDSAVRVHFQVCILVSASNK